MRCVLDTNVFVSVLLAPRIEAARGSRSRPQQGTILLSFATLTELYEVLSREQFRRYIADLLALHPFQGIQILAPSELLDLEAL